MFDKCKESSKYYDKFKVYCKQYTYIFIIITPINLGIDEGNTNLEHISMTPIK